MLDALRRIQRSEKLGMRISQRAGADSELLLIADSRSEIVENDRRLVRQSLHLRPDAEVLHLTFGSVQRNDSEVALLTRSMSEIFSEIAATIDARPSMCKKGGQTPRLPFLWFPASGTRHWCVSSQASTSQIMPIRPCAIAITGSG